MDSEPKHYQRAIPANGRFDPWISQTEGGRLITWPLRCLFKPDFLEATLLTTGDVTSTLITTGDVTSTLLTTGDVTSTLLTTGDVTTSQPLVGFTKMADCN